MSELEEIEARIERDRAELGRSLGKLSDTLSAGGLTAELGSAAKSSGGAIARQAFDVAKSNPAAFALAAAGLGLFLAHSANRHSKTGEPTLAAGSQPPASDDTTSNGKADRIHHTDEFHEDAVTHQLDGSATMLSSLRID